MIEKKLKTTQGRITIKIPTTLNEITLGQMIDLQQTLELDDLQAISILSGIPVEQIQDISDIGELHSFGEAVLSLSQQIKNLYDSDAIPKKVIFFADSKPVTVKVAKDLSVEPVGAFMAAREIINDEIKEYSRLNEEDNSFEYFRPSLTACCEVLAQYFYCRATGKPYNEYKVDEFCDEIKKMRVTEALPISKHFFTCYPALSKQKTNFYTRLQRLWKKGLEYNRLKNSGISIP